MSTTYINNFHTSKCSERTEWFAIAEAEDPSKHGIVEIPAEDDGEDIKQRRHAVGAVHGLCRCPQCRDPTLNPGADWR